MLKTNRNKRVRTETVILTITNKSLAETTHDKPGQESYRVIELNTVA